jgi:hypothetical protein
VVETLSKTSSLTLAFHILLLVLPTFDGSDLNSMTKDQLFRDHRYLVGQNPLRIKGILRGFKMSGGWISERVKHLDTFNSEIYGKIFFTILIYFLFLKSRCQKHF